MSIYDNGRKRKQKRRQTLKMSQRLKDEIKPANISISFTNKKILLSKAKRLKAKVWKDTKTIHIICKKGVQWLC